MDMGEPPDLTNPSVATLPLSPQNHKGELTIDERMDPHRCRKRSQSEELVDLGLKTLDSCEPYEESRVGVCKRIRMSVNIARPISFPETSDRILSADATAVCANATGQSTSDSVHASDLPDEIWFRCYSFLHNKAHWESLSFHDLFRSMSSVSKDVHNRLLRYVKQVPQDFIYEEDDGNLDAILWACRNQIKLGKVDFRSCESCAEFNLCLLMLRMCNITDMHTLKIKTFWFADDELKTLRIAHLAFRAGVHLDEVLKEINPIDFQKNLARCIHKRCRALRKVSVSSKHNEMHIPLITAFSKTLVDVTLKLFEGSDGVEAGNDLEAFSHVVTNMPKLKKLKINACLKASISVKSKSLTKIDVRSSLGGFYISKCVCPSLAIFRSSYFVKDNRWNGVRPVARICVQEELEKNYAEDKRIIDLQVSSNPFHGMHVPETCIVRTFLQKKNYS